MSKRKASPVVMSVAKAAAAFGLTVQAAKQFIKDAEIGKGDQVEIGALAAFIARTTIGNDHAQAA